MLNLYWKVFLGFWLSTITIISGAVLVTHYLPVTSTNVDVTPPRLLLEQALQALQKGQVKGLRDWAAAAEEKSKTHTLLLNEKNLDLLSGEAFAPKRAELLALTKIGPQHGLVAINNGARIYMVRALRVANDITLLRLIIDTPNEQSQLQQLFVRSLWPRLFIALLISALVCYLLTGNFTIPIKQLRYATQQVASGNYDVRVSKSQRPNKDELDLLARDFDSMTEKVQSTLNNQQRLIKDVSHELRSPLARMQVALGLAQQRYPSEEMPELQRVDDEVQILNEVIEQILSLPQQNLKLDDALDLTGLLTHLVEVMQPEAATKQIKLLLQTDLDEAIVRTRGRLLDGVFENLLKNAIRYTPVASTITLRCQTTDKHVIVEVRDEGPGVSEEHLEHIFEPFYRASDARDRDSGGYGLGLAIAQRSVTLHHGEIRAYNIASGGLCVSVTLPLDDQETHEGVS